MFAEQADASRGSDGNGGTGCLHGQIRGGEGGHGRTTVRGFPREVDRT